jgi:hypothetical protein
MTIARRAALSIGGVAGVGLVVDYKPSIGLTVTSPILKAFTGMSVSCDEVWRSCESPMSLLHKGSETAISSSIVADSNEALFRNIYFFPSRDFKTTGRWPRVDKYSALASFGARPQLLIFIYGKCSLLCRRKARSTQAL